MADRWMSENADGTYTVGEGDEEIATCKYREDALILRGGFLLDEEDIDDLFKRYGVRIRERAVQLTRAVESAHYIVKR
jgi:hypothetical protein